MTQQDLNNLANIYNSFLGVHTNGPDTFLMTDCMRSLQDFIFTKQREINEENKEV